MSTKPNLKVVTDCAPAKQPFIADAERDKLPLVNVRDSGAPTLSVDDVLRRSERRADSDGSK